MTPSNFIKKIGDNARASTAMLEMCGWDEEELDALFVKITAILDEVTKGFATTDLENISNTQRIALYNVLRYKIGSIVEDHQIDTTMEYLSKMLSINSGEETHD